MEIDTLVGRSILTNCRNPQETHHLLLFCSQPLLIYSGTQNLAALLEIVALEVFQRKENRLKGLAL